MQAVTAVCVDFVSYHELARKGWQMPLTRGVIVRENYSMRTGGALLLIAILGLQPVCVFGNVPTFGTNAAAEKIYVPQLRQEILIPIVVIAVGFSLTALLARARRKASHGTLGTAEVHHP
jgi:hypothetical protein